jgi:uncharacterized iron-regulated membrane protein
MSQAELWLRRPQNVWLRRAVFQVHLWSGIILGIYVFLVCLSGSAVVFRNDLYDLLFAKTRVAVSGKPLTRDQMTQAAQRAYPGYTVQTIHRGRFPTEATDILLVKGWRHKDRLFDPYQGRDIGPSVEIYYGMLHFASDLHGNLLFGAAGLQANAVGGFLISMMCVTGMVVWWPGIANWRRGLTLRRDVGWKRFNWDLHSAIGFWTVSLILVWALTGAYFVFPDPFRAAVELFTPINPPRIGPAVAGAVLGLRRGPRPPLTTGQKILRGFSFAHYGNFGGWPVKALWVILGLAPPALFVTGLLMWWNRVLGPAARKFLRGSEAASIEGDLAKSRPAIR